MSQLIDKLKHVAKTAPQPMGFRTAQAAPARPRMQLIAGVAQENVAALGALISGADAVLVSMSAIPEAKAIEKMARSLAGLPWGGWLKAAGEKEIDVIAAAGADFAVFPADSPVSLAQPGNKLGKLLQVSSALAEGLLRAANDLPVDAVLVTGDALGEGPLTWSQLMQFQRAENMLTKPLIVPVPSSITKEELQALWEMGVDGLVVAVNREQPAGRMKELCQLVIDLAKSARRKRGKAEALLPSMRMGGAAEAGEEEEEDGDE